jgi:hypothetical protein
MNAQPYLGPFPSERWLRLPGELRFQLWEDTTRYTRTYYVDQAHPEAADTNPGTEARPLCSIGRAATLVAPGERVVVKSGVYRERIAPAQGGRSPEQMICYAAAPGARVVVKGSRVLPTAWEPSVDSHGARFSSRLWQAPLPDDLFPDAAHPFNTPNASDAEIGLMPWAHQWKGRVPYTLPRGLVFEDGRRMVPLALYEDLVRRPGAYWVDRDRGLLHIHPLPVAAPDPDPNGRRYEVTVQSHLLRPMQIGLGYIRVQGFVFEHAGNGFPRVGVGAVDVRGGHHWILEDNVVRHCNAVGIEAGARVTESRASSEAENARVAAHEGGFIIRNNTVYDCGTGGIQGHTVRDSLIAGNHIHHIGWQDVERYWECAAIKTLCNRRTLVVGNHIHDVAAASAIWLDWDNRRCRITRNVVHDIHHTHNGAVFIEASRVPNWIDHNVIWNARCIAVTLFDTDNAGVWHNLIAHARTPVSARVNTDRSLDGVRLTSRGNAVQNNLFYRNAALPQLEDVDNVCDHNVYGPGCAEDLGGREHPDWDAHSRSRDLRLTLDPATLALTLATDRALPDVPAVAASPVDARPDARVHPGPLPATFVGSVTYELVSH